MSGSPKNLIRPRTGVWGQRRVSKYHYLCTFENRLYKRGAPKSEFIHKNYVFILTCLNFSHLSSLYWMQYTHQDFPLLSFWSRWFWCLLVLLPFLFHLLHVGKMFPFEDFFSSKKTKRRSHLERSQVNREVRAWESGHFWSKTAEHSVQCGQVHW